MSGRVSRRALCAALLFAPLLARAAADPAQALIAGVRQRLVQAPVLRADFEQRKTVKGFRNPLVSRGDLLVLRERGVVWRTREPFASTLVLTRERLLSRNADGSVATRLEARDEPGLRAVNQMLFALMAADVQQLAQRFQVQGGLGADGSWRLVLAPRDAALAQWVTRIELEGERHLRRVALHEAQGDSSLIRLDRVQTADAPTREEETRLE